TIGVDEDFLRRDVLEDTPRVEPVAVAVDVTAHLAVGPAEVACDLAEETERVGAAGRRRRPLLATVGELADGAGLGHGDPSAVAGVGGVCGAGCSAPCGRGSSRAMRLSTSTALTDFSLAAFSAFSRGMVTLT